MKLSNQKWPKWCGEKKKKERGKGKRGTWTKCLIEAVEERCKKNALETCSPFREHRTNAEKSHDSLHIYNSERRDKLKQVSFLPLCCLLMVVQWWSPLVVVEWVSPCPLQQLTAGTGLLQIFWRISARILRFRKFGEIPAVRWAGVLGRPTLAWINSIGSINCEWVGSEWRQTPRRLGREYAKFYGSFIGSYRLRVLVYFRSDDAVWRDSSREVCVCV